MFNPTTLRFARTFTLSSILSRCAFVLLIVAMLLANTLVMQAQTNPAEGSDNPRQLFLPLVAAGAPVENSVTQTDPAGTEETTESPAEDNLADYAFVLQSAGGNIVQAASVNSIFNVTKFADTNDGACTFFDCSLREALSAANADPTTHDLVNLPAGTYELTLAGLTVINASISGADVNTTVISGNKFNLLTFVKSDLSGMSAKLEKVTLRDGKSAILHYEGTLSISNVRIEQMSGASIISKSGENEDAEAIYLQNSISNNTIALINVYGEIKNSVLQNSRVGVDMAGSEVLIADTTITSNGKGLYIGNSSSVEIQNSAILYNNSNGGMTVQGSFVQITNSTISNNTDLDNGAGGIAIRDGSIVNLDFVTIVENSFQGSDFGAGGLHVYQAGTFNIKHSILANNKVAYSLEESNCNVINSQGNNLFDTLEDCNVKNMKASDTSGVEPLLLGLNFNGGTTKNHKPIASSPAVDKLEVIRIVVSEMNVDQRYIARPSDGNGDGNKLSDIGAIER